MDLPEGGQPDRPLDKNDIRTIEVGRSGGFISTINRCRLIRLNKNWLQIIKAIRIFLVYVRADHRGTYGTIAAVLNRCEQNGITRVSLRTEPE
ncbi:MAG: hypothetical protein CM1200mP29_05350 [Verrucomicrobiota bacterium]|nr:MAG: hypothetical protein CM1200mP29_05350 [Verrucomicrobiota bacterium]